MCELIRLAANDIAVGEIVRTEDDTQWGVRVAWHRLASIKCDLETRLVVIELRDGPTLRYLLRLEPGAELTIRRGQ